MTQFVAEQPGQFGFVLQIDHDAAGNAHRPARKGVGIDVVGIEHAVRIRHLRPMDGAIQALADGGQIAVHGIVLDRPEVLGKLLRRDFLVNALFLFLTHADQDRTAADRRCRATAQCRCAEQPEHIAPTEPVSFEMIGQGIKVVHSGSFPN